MSTFREAILLLGIAMLPVIARSQLRLPADYRLLSGDEALLAGDEDRKDLPCQLTIKKPEMGFDLRFHSGYNVTLPLKALAGSDNRLRVLIRITALPADGSPVILISHVSVPFIDPSAGEDVEIPGEYAVGPGRYQVDWLMRDRGERVCSSRWTIEAKLDEAYQGVSMPIQKDTVEALPLDGFGALAPVERDEERPLRLKVLINFSPGDPKTLNGRDLRAITSIVRFSP